MDCRGYLPHVRVDVVIEMLDRRATLTDHDSPEALCGPGGLCRPEPDPMDLFPGGSLTSLLRGWHHRIIEERRCWSRGHDGECNYGWRVRE